MLKPSSWLIEQVQEYENLGATLVGYGIPRNDINYVYDFPKCIYAILKLPSPTKLFVCEEEYKKFHDGWSSHLLDNHCWWEENEIGRLSFESFSLINTEGFWL